MARPYSFSFSYSRWSLWSKCPAAFKYANIDKLPRAKSPAMERGIKIHDAIAGYVGNKTDAFPEAGEKFSLLLRELRTLPEAQKAVEMQLAFDKEQRRCDWFGPNAYWRFIWDVGVFNEHGKHFNAIDWKTGKPYGSYTDQMQIFTIPAFWMIPDLESFTGHLLYLDSGDSVKVTYTREQFYGPSCDPANRDGLYGLWLSNVEMMEADRTFRPTPSQDACRFCDFHSKRGGPCNVGV